MKMLMVCLGNICRSPMAEGVMRHKVEQAGLDWQIDSAGTSHYHTGCAPHHLSQMVAKSYGIDLCEQRCRQFSADDMEKFDKIFVMDENNYEEVKRIARNRFNVNKVDLLMNEVYPGENIPVPDPYYGSEADYHEVYNMIDLACDKIIHRYSQKMN